MRVPLAVAALLAFLVPPAAGAADSPTLCAASEQAVFTCPTGRKMVALCAARPVSRGASFRYVFGAPGAPEMSLRDVRVTRGSMPLSGGGIDYLRVRNGAYAYVLYSGIGRGFEQDGLIVEKDGRVVSAALCKGLGLTDAGLSALDAARPPVDRQGLPWPPARR